MPCKASDILNLARQQIGIKESPANSNNVIYNTEYYGGEVNGTQFSWCCAFIWWLFKFSMAPELFFDGNKTAGCTTFMRWAKGTDRWVTFGYQPGDLVLYDFDGDRSEAEHIGIVESASGGIVTAIEGNTGSTSDANGGEVMRRVRSTSLIIGAYRPAYDDVDAVTPSDSGNMDAPTYPLPAGYYFGPKSGPVCSVSGYFNHREDLRTWQQRMADRGWNIEADGYYGDQTADVARKFQAEKGLEVDGLIGPVTWKAAWTKPIT